MKPFKELKPSEKEAIYSSANVADSLYNTVCCMPDEDSDIPAEIKATMDETHYLGARAGELLRIYNAYMKGKEIPDSYLDKHKVKHYEK